MSPEQLLERNRAFVRGHEAKPLPPAESIDLAVVACYDPRLDPLLLPALGLQPAEAFLLRVAGALVQPAGGVMRSLALGIFMFDVRNVVVVGHSSCRMAQFEASTFIDKFRGRGVQREAFGSMDLREWAGAIPDPKRGVQMSAANIAAAPFLPSDVTVSGLILDDTTGELTVVSTGREQTAHAVEAPTPAARAGDEPTPPAPQAAAAPEIARAAELPPLGGAVGTFVDRLEALGRWPQDVRRLRQALAGEKNPIAQLHILKTFAQQASRESSDVARAYEALKRALSRTARGKRG